ncbi:MAG: ABC transporter substrate-binding protein [Actinomycetota bacterium]|nr:ABC transporter substrate-binding protein [Actinomycetota bacterium]
MTKVVRPLALAAVIGLVAVACSNASTSAPPGGASSSTGTTTIGEGEGKLSLVAWAGYTEDDWVKPFEQQTGCKVDVKYGNTSDDMVNLMRQGGGTIYDGVSASGDATNRLIANGDVASIDTALFPDYADVMPTLQNPPHNTVDGVHYGVPYVWGPNLLLYNTDVVKPAPDSWSSVFEANSPYAGKITAYDSPIYIADAALYLKATQPDLGIDDPYELTSDQLDAATELLKTQNSMIGKYWAVYTDEISGFDSGDMVIGTAWPVNQQYIEIDNKVPVASTIPSEGVTGWADTWMMSSNAAHPNCMLMWMKYTLTSDVQTQVAEFYGATPSNTASCPQLDKDLGKAADIYHCGDDQFLSSVALWKTPLADCGNGSSDCMDYSAWTEKWLEIQAG